VLPLSNHNANNSCTSLVFSNVTARGDMMINISIPAIVGANPSAPGINISLYNVTLEDGSSLVIDSTGYQRAGSRQVSRS
jgi:hypothetical protein